MTLFEDNMNTLLAGLTLEQVTALAEAAKRRQSEMENDLINNARAEFVKAYQDFRKLAPNAIRWVDWEYKACNGDIEVQDFDLYAMLDRAIGERVV